MSEITNATTAVTRNFLVDTDDLVDELLSAIKALDWTNLKMQYQLSKLQASKKANSAYGSYDLFADWKEFDEEVQLRIEVAGSADSLADRQQQCLELMDALFPNDIFRKVNEDN